MYRGTTPMLRFNLSKNQALDLNEVKQIWVTLKSSSYSYKKTWDIDHCTIDTVNKKVIIELTQEETLALPVTIMDAQIRILLNNDKALSTNIRPINVKEILEEGVIE